DLAAGAREGPRDVGPDALRDGARADHADAQPVAAHAGPRGLPVLIGVDHARLRALEVMERVNGIEPSTTTLATLCSTTELHPLLNASVLSRPVIQAARGPGQGRRLRPVHFGHMLTWLACLVAPKLQDLTEAPAVDLPEPSPHAELLERARQAWTELAAIPWQPRAGLDAYDIMLGVACRDIVTREADQHPDTAGRTPNY